MCVFSCTSLKQSKTFADDGIGGQNLEVETHSVFIHTPTHSAIHNNKLFFVDEFDDMIKIYDIAENQEKFLEKTLSIATYTVIDTSYSNGYMFMLVEHEQTTKILAVELNPESNSPVTQIQTADSIDTFSKINVSHFGTDLNTKYLVSLTPNTASTNPLVIVLNNELTVTKTVTINPVGETNQSNFVEFLVLKSTDTNYHFIFGYEHKLFYSPCTISTIESSSGAETAPLTPFPDDAIPKDSDFVISNVDLIEISNDENLNLKTAFLLTFKNTADLDIDSTSSVYTYSIDNDDASKTSFSSLTNLASYSKSTCVSTSGKYLIYPNNQSIIYQEVVEKGSTLFKPKNEIKNPAVEATYYNTSEYTYVTAIKQTAILPSPWSDTPLHTINITDDIVVVGTGMIKDTDTEIIDYYFCMYTATGSNAKLYNYFGYVKKTDVTLKSEYTNSDYTDVFMVAKGTKLYYQPTISTNIITEDTNIHNIVLDEPKTIPDNSKIKLESTICKYTSNGRVFVKVCVNGKESGFIDADKIIFPNPSVDFIITNASIKSDDTKVYNEDGTAFDTLDKGFRVRVNGNRNTKTGYTSVSYNDEYGNVYTGYILTDTIKTNTWSTLQILGSVLIAINIGLLILILIFKKRKIGYHGEKYQKEEKPNYKQNKVLKNEE